MKYHNAVTIWDGNEGSFGLNRVLLGQHCCLKSLFFLSVGCTVLSLFLAPVLVFLPSPWMGQ
jgi:hypothetical protein